MASVTEPGNRVTTYSYDTFERVNSVTERAGTALARTSKVAYNALGETISTTDPLGTKSSIVYNALGQVTSMTAAVGLGVARTSSMTYDTLGRTLSMTDPRGNITAFAYDDIARTATTTDALGNITTASYDLDGRMIAVTDAYGKSWTTTYDLQGRATASTDPLGNTVQYQHLVDGSKAVVIDPLNHAASASMDRFGRTATATDALGNTTSFAYDRSGNRVQIADASANSTLYQFDSLNRVSVETDPRGKQTKYEYTTSNDLKSITDRIGRKREFTLDSAGRTTAEVWKDASGATVQTQTFGYDLLDRLTAANDPDGNYALTYDALGQVQTVGGPFGVNLTFGYDLAGNRTQVADNKNSTTTSTFDALNRLATRSETVVGLSAMRVDFGYTKTGQLANETRFADASGTTKVATSSMSYDDANRLTGIALTKATGTVIADYLYEYDAASRLSKKTENGTVKTYGYDVTNQLTGDNGVSVSYDKTGNRNGTGYATTAGNRMTNDGTWTYGYNDLGEVTSKSKSGESWSYAYDHRGQMTNATSDTDVSVTYKFDAFGNRIERDATVSGTTTVEKFVVDGWDKTKPGAIGTENFDTILDLDGAGNVITRRMFGAGFDAPLARQDAAGAIRWYGVDNLGSVRTIIDNSGNVTNATDYAAFGAFLGGVPVDRYAYTGREWDAAIGLQYSRARMYDTANGRFHSEDSERFAAGDVNLARYVGNAVNGATDPSGLAPNPERWHWHHIIPAKLFKELDLDANPNFEWNGQHIREKNHVEPDGIHAKNGLPEDQYTTDVRKRLKEVQKTKGGKLNQKDLEKVADEIRQGKGAFAKYKDYFNDSMKVCKTYYETNSTKRAHEIHPLTEAEKQKLETRIKIRDAVLKAQKEGKIAGRVTAKVMKVAKSLTGPVGFVFTVFVFTEKASAKGLPGAVGDELVGKIPVVGTAIAVIEVSSNYDLFPDEDEIGLLESIDTEIIQPAVREVVRQSILGCLSDHLYRMIGLW